MKLAYSDYIKLVVATFNKMKQAGDLSPLLTTITRASIRQECFNIYTERVKKGEREETNTLKAFFGVPAVDQDFASVIEYFRLDKFRALEGLIKKGKRNPGSESVELLAWLINFQHRPYGREVILSDEELAIVNDGKVSITNTPAQEMPEEDHEEKTELGDQIDINNTVEPSIPKENEENEAEGDPEKNPSTDQVVRNETIGKGETGPQEPSNGEKGKKRRRAVIAFLFVFIAFAGGAYTVWQGDNSNELTAGKANTGCMYWTGVQYEEIRCDDLSKGQLLLPIDREKMKSFHRITQTDTITERSIGKVYYIKNKGTIEFYTAGGMHPIEVTRYLVKLSPYMFDKYLKKL